MDGRDTYGIITCVQLIVVFRVGMQPPRQLVITHCSNAGAGWGCYLSSSKFVRVKVGEL